MTSGQSIRVSGVVLVAAVTLLAACTASASGQEAAVVVRDFKFSPAKVKVPAGARVVWTNEDSVVHTVTSGSTSGANNIPDGQFDEQLQEKGTRAGVTFDDPGTYTYYCSRHNVMSGVVRVTG